MKSNWGLLVIAGEQSIADRHELLQVKRTHAMFSVLAADLLSGLH